MLSMPTVVIIDKNSDIAEQNLKNITENELYKKCNFRKPDDFDKRHSWKLDSTVITLYAKNSGRANNENKYDFPPPIDKELYFGSCILFAQDLENKYIDLKKSEWEKIYEKLFGGFENLDNFNDEEEEDELDNVPESKKTKEGYLKDDFIADDSESVSVSDEDNEESDCCSELTEEDYLYSDDD